MWMFPAQELHIFPTTEVQDEPIVQFNKTQGFEKRNAAVPGQRLFC